MFITAVLSLNLIKCKNLTPQFLIFFIKKCEIDNLSLKVKNVSQKLSKNHRINQQKQERVNK